MGKGEHARPRPHIGTPVPARADRNSQASWATLLFYQLSLTCSKISILLLYRRVLTHSWARRAAWVLLAVVVIYNILYLVSTATLCIPIEALWNPAVKGRCHTGPLIMWVAIGLHIVTDFLIFALPVPVVLSMTATQPQRIILLLIFALGFLYVKPPPCPIRTRWYLSADLAFLRVCVISLLRAILIRLIIPSADLTWDFVTIAHCTSVEVNASVVCACLLATKPLLAVLRRKLRHRSWLRLGAMSLGSGQSTVRTVPVTVIRLPSSMDRLEGRYGRDRMLSSGTGAEDSTAAMGNVAQQYAAAMKEVAAVRQGERLDI